MAMISEHLWRRKFGSTPSILGTRLTIDGVGRTVVGVVPASFSLRMQNFQRDTASNELYLPIGDGNPATFYANRGAGWGMDALGRLKSGVTLKQAREDMERVSRQLTATYPQFDRNQTANLVPLKEEMVGKMRPMLLILLGAVGFVLLICCVNVANLLLARSSARRREFAIRLAMGAGQMRMVRQLLTESLLLAMIGGGLGLLLARFATSAAIAAAPRSVPRAEEIVLDYRVLLFTFLTTAVAGLVFGLAPALKTSRLSLSGTLKETGRSLAGVRSGTYRVFVVLEMAMALVLLVGAGLMIRTLAVLWAVDPGFSPHNVLMFDISPPASLKQESPAAIRNFFREVHRTIASTAGVKAVSLSWAATPMGGDSEDNFWFTGRPKPIGQNDLPMALMYLVEPDYFRTLQVALRHGRLFSENDNEHTTPVMVVDEALAEKYFHGRETIGQYLEIGDQPKRQIIGVVSHVNQWGLASDLSNPLHAQIYYPAAQMPDSAVKEQAGAVTVYVRGRQAGQPSFEVLRRRLVGLNGSLVASGNEQMDEAVAHSIASTKFAMMLLAAFAGLALLMASVGIYGVLSYLVGQRTQEIGVRVALGAKRLDVLRMVLSDGARMTADRDRYRDERGTGDDTTDGELVVRCSGQRSRLLLRP